MVAVEAGAEKVDRRRRKRTPVDLTPVERTCLHLWAEQEESIAGLARIFGWSEGEVLAALDRAQGKLLAGSPQKSNLSSK